MKEKNDDHSIPTIRLKGQFATALVYARSVDENAITQIVSLCNQPFSEGTHIRVMPDVHTGAGCVIGLTMDLNRSDAVCPNLVGVDIGCGVRVSELGVTPINLQQLDKDIRESVPSGQNVHRHTFPEDRDFFYSLFNDLIIKDQIKSREKMGWLERSLGTLGGGNHFIEVDVDEEGRSYLTVHTGSRHFGLTLAQLYQAKAISKMQRNGEARRSRAKGAPKDLAYLTGSDRNNYLHDIQLIQTYAKRNRERIAERILQKMGLKELASFESVHNYIDEKNILRKGAIAAHVGQPVIIPLNMRDGCILGTGKGNPEWNWSAPHGAGRLMSRREAKRILSIDEFRDQMKGVFSTCVDRTTIDESPMVYKAMEEILPVLGQTVDVRRIIRPIYNFKAAE